MALIDLYSISLVLALASLKLGTSMALLVYTVLIGLGWISLVLTLDLFHFLCYSQPYPVWSRP